MSVRFEKQGGVDAPPCFSIVTATVAPFGTGRSSGTTDVSPPPSNVPARRGMPSWITQAS